MQLKYLSAISSEESISTIAEIFLLEILLVTSCMLEEFISGGITILNLSIIFLI